MDEEKQTLGNEIRQLIVQYRKEVPGKRRAWPESIKLRVGKLCELGLSAREITNLTEISYFNVLSWIKRSPHYRAGRGQARSCTSGHFVPVQIRDQSDISTVTVKTSTAISATSCNPQISTVTVTLPNGIRIEGATADFLKSWLGQSHAL